MTVIVSVDWRVGVAPPRPTEAMSRSDASPTSATPTTHLRQAIFFDHIAPLVDVADAHYRYRAVIEMGQLPSGERALTGPDRELILWRSLRALLTSADVDGVLANKLGPIAALYLKEQGMPVPVALESQAQLARAVSVAAVALLSRIRSLCDGPLVLIKGPELAALYPGRARAFTDVDLLTPNAEAVHAALRAAGFVEVDDPELFEHHHHLRPLQLPALWLNVEVHLRPMWPEGLRPPPIEEIVAAAIPSATGVAGILAPAPAHHAVILASHAWVHAPLDTLRDLVDVAAIAARADEATLSEAAGAWGLERIWRTTYGAATALLGGERSTLATRVWARHLATVSERSVAGNHLERWLHGFWELPFRRALRWTVKALQQEVFPYPDETWREKLIRVVYALAHPRTPVSSHERAWRRAAGAGESSPDNESDHESGVGLGPS